MLTPFNEACKLILGQLIKIRCFTAFKFSFNNRMKMFSLDRMWMSRIRVTLQKNKGPTTQHMVENRSPSPRFIFFTQISLYHHHHHHYHHLFLYIICQSSVIYLSIFLSTHTNRITTQYVGTQHKIKILNPFSKIMRLSRWWSQSIEPMVGPCWAWAWCDNTDYKRVNLAL